MDLFLPITKVDETQRLVYARAAEEKPDRTRPVPEIMDYASSKPNFEKWSGEQYEASLSKSYGNVRVMHQKIAAGHIAEPLTFDDDEKAIDVVIKVTDDNEWEKCVAGTYTGLSVGGSYAPNSKKSEMVEGTRVLRYTAIPNEISLVDRPMIPGATFKLVKADGSEGEQAFAKIAERGDASPEEGEKKYGDVAYADPKNKKYPIDTEAHVRAALSYWGMPKNRAKYSTEDQKTIGARIRAAAKKFGIGAKKEAEKVDKAEGTPIIDCYDTAMDVLNKWAGEEISDVSSAVYALQSIVYLYQKEGTEANPEADAQVKLLQDAIKALKGFIVSEIQESDENDVINLAERIDGLAKNEAIAELMKAGASISASNMQRVQAIHDHAAALGADCGASKADGAGELQKLEATHTEALTKITGERDEALTKIESLTADKGRYDAMLRKVLDIPEGKILTLDELEALPAPAKGATKAVAVTKVEDAGGTADERPDFNKIQADKGPEAAALAEIEAINRHGAVPIA